jgi:hypothetical protein
MVVKISEKISYKFFCENCNYKCNKQSEYTKHLMTAKHKMIVNDSEKYPLLTKNTNNMYECICGKMYKYDSGYYRHKKICKWEVNDNITAQMNQTNTVQTMIELIKQNQEFKQLLIEQNQTIIELSKKDTTTNTINNTTNNNQKFNLNFFLNNTCKDAMNISEFIEDMEVQFADIENIGRDGYVTGMTNMIMSRIKNLDVTKRPMHCTDLKRETIYIKDNNVWEKDDDNKKLHNMIQCIAHKNYAILPEWRDKNPDCLNSDTPKFNFCIKMMTNVLGDTGEGQIKLDNKVIRNIAKHINVDKNTNTL